jgi:hypothetical protein
VGRSATAREDDPVPERSEKIGVGFEEENIKAARNTFS